MRVEGTSNVDSTVFFEMFVELGGEDHGLGARYWIKGFDGGTKLGSKVEEL